MTNPRKWVFWIGAVVFGFGAFIACFAPGGILIPGGQNMVIIIPPFGGERFTLSMEAVMGAVFAFYGLMLLVVAILVPSRFWNREKDGITFEQVLEQDPKAFVRLLFWQAAMIGGMVATLHLVEDLRIAIPAAVALAAYPAYAYVRVYTWAKKKHDALLAREPHEATHHGADQSF